MNVSGQSLLERFSLDWVANMTKPVAAGVAPTGSPASPASTAQMAALSAQQEAVRAFSQPLLRLLATLPGRQARLQELLDLLLPEWKDLSYDGLRVIVRALEEQQLIKVTPDQRGNDLVALP